MENKKSLDSSDFFLYFINYIHYFLNIHYFLFYHLQKFHI